MAKAIDIAQVTYEVPDLALMERFMTDFGLTRVSSDDGVLYMRGAGHQHQLHATRQAAKQRFVGAALEVSSHEDLKELAAFPGSSAVEENTEPGGGLQVRMTTPDGVEIRALWGRARHDPQDVRAPHLFNNIEQKPRVAASIRSPRQPCAAMRLGHFVLHVSNHDETVQWFCERFGMMPSDYFTAPGTEWPPYGTFLRFDRGATLVDHHALLVLQSDWVGVHHCSFEVTDLDAVMSAHDYLLAQGWTLDVGVGRHMMGSQVFDYWKDPFGFRVEHYTDGDTVDASFKPGVFNGTASETTQWGMEPPNDFFE